MRSFIYLCLLLGAAARINQGD